MVGILIRGYKTISSAVPSAPAPTDDSVTKHPKTRPIMVVASGRHFLA